MRSCSIMSTVVCNFLLISNSAGLYPFCKGVALYDNSAKHRSDVFIHMVLIVFTALFDFSIALRE